MWTDHSWSYNNGMNGFQTFQGTCCTIRAISMSLRTTLTKSTIELTPSSHRSLPTSHTLPTPATWHIRLTTYTTSQASTCSPKVTQQYPYGSANTGASKRAVSLLMRAHAQVRVRYKRENKPDSCHHCCNLSKACVDICTKNAMWICTCFVN